MKDTVPYFWWCLRCSFSPFVIGGHVACRKDGEYGARGRSRGSPWAARSAASWERPSSAAPTCTLQWLFRADTDTLGKHKPSSLLLTSAFWVPKIFCAGSCCRCFKESVTFMCSGYVWMSKLPAANHNPKQGGNSSGDIGDKELHRSQ